MTRDEAEEMRSDLLAIIELAHEVEMVGDPAYARFWVALDAASDKWAVPDPAAQCARCDHRRDQHPNDFWCLASSFCRCAKFVTPTPAADAAS